MSTHEIIGKGLLAVLAGASGKTPEEEATSILDEEKRKEIEEEDAIDAKYRKKIVK